MKLDYLHRMKKLILIISLFCVLLPAVSATDARVGLYLLNLGKCDIATGGFTADFYLSFKCDSNCSVDGYEFMNGRASSADKIIDTPTEKFYRIQANLNSPIDLRRFPFDTQKVEIILEDKTLTTDKLRYTVNNDESGIDPSIIFAGWNIDGWRAEVDEHVYEAYDETYSRYIYTVDISKIAFNSFIKTFLPVIFGLIIVMSSFLMDPDKITTRLAMVSSGLVASVMFHISISNQIPPVSYLTFADKFMMLTYFVLLASFVLNIILLQYVETKQMAKVAKIHARTEYAVFIVVPLLYLALFLFWL